MANTRFSRNKSCGCLIGTAVVTFEIERKKKALRLQEINKRLKNLKDKNKIKKFKEERLTILRELKEANANKEQMKARFHKHIKESGYVPPRFKTTFSLLSAKKSLTKRKLERVF